MKDNEILLKTLNLLKIILGLLIVIIILLVVGVSKLYDNNTSTHSDNNTNTNSEENYNTNYDVSMFEEIEAKDISSKTKKTKQVIYVGRETCGWCTAFLPNLWQAQEDYDFTTLYIDIAKIINFNNNTISDQDAYDTMMALTGDDYEEYMEENFGATPMILVIEKGKIIAAQTGYSEYESFKPILENAGY